MERSQGKKIVFIFNERCDICLSDSSPVIITRICIHRFCVKCILHLWSRQNLREPCVCPIDGVKMLCLRPRRPYQPEEITSLVRVYNRSFNPRLDMAQAKLSANITWLYCANTALFLAGAIAYWYKVP